MTINGNSVKSTYLVIKNGNNSDVNCSIVALPFQFLMFIYLRLQKWLVVFIINQGVIRSFCGVPSCLSLKVTHHPMWICWFPEVDGVGDGRLSLGDAAVGLDVSLYSAHAALYKCAVNTPVLRTLYCVIAPGHTDNASLIIP